MKKLTNYQRTAQYLNKVFKLINEEYFNNELEVPTITIQSTVGAYGHVSVKKSKVTMKFMNQTISKSK